MFCLTEAEPIPSPLLAFGGLNDLIPEGFFPGVFKNLTMGACHRESINKRKPQANNRFTHGF